MFRKTMEEYEADTRKKLVIDIREKEAFDKETMHGALHMDSETLKQQNSQRIRHLFTCCAIQDSKVMHWQRILKKKAMKYTVYRTDSVHICG